MNPIRQLDKSLINKIAAGEVVERPLSVVKELTENAIDAGATTLAIEIQNGGLSLVRVADNGSGIPAEQIELAFAQHATSKLTDIEDLQSIGTLGFRGEALASIASVSQIEMITKTSESTTGTRIELHSGTLVARQELGCTVGTALSVSNLFFNTPARLKFLKKPAIEAGYVTDFVQRLALGYPGVAFQYISNGQTILQTNGNGDLRTAVYKIYGGTLAKGLIPIVPSDSANDESANLVTGYLGKPEIARGSRAGQHFFMNGRFIKSNLLQAAVEEAYQTMLLAGKFPVCILHLNVPPEQVDVNVHPAKLEVRFAEESKIFQRVVETVRHTLTKTIERPFLQTTQTIAIKEANSTIDSITKEAEARAFTAEPTIINELDIAKPNKIENKIESEDTNTESTQPKPPVLKKLPRLAPRLNISGIDTPISPHLSESRATQNVGEDSNINLHAEYATIHVEEAKPGYSLMGQIFGTYWLVVQGDELFLIDQHAAHERVLYEDLLDKLNEELISQTLLSPIHIPLSPHELQIAKGHTTEFEKIGFEWDETQYGIALRSIPFMCRGVDIAFFTELLGKLEITGNMGSSTYIREQVAMAACKSAIKAKDNIAEQEVETLVARLMSLENPFTCPHGRPTIVKYTKTEIERMFKRT